MSLSFTSSSYHRLLVVPKHPLSISKTLKNLHFFKPMDTTKPFSLNSINPSQPHDPITHLEQLSIAHLPKNLQEIIKLFQSVQDPRAKYDQILFYGKNLKPLDDKFKVDENKVKGCVSQVWLRAFFDEEKKVIMFEGDSDTFITKGLAALLVQGLSGAMVDEVLRVSPDFILLLGLSQRLTSSRNNGFLNMLELMQKKTLRLISQEQEDAVNEMENVDDLMREKAEENEVENVEFPIDEGRWDGGGLGSRGARILELLTRELDPSQLDVKDVSYEHAGYAGVRGSDAETHFNLRVVSSEFQRKSMVKRHRLVYSLLDGELQSGLHALSIEAKTPDEVGS